jgi:hypothetical protein
MLGALFAGTLSACGALPGATDLGAADDATAKATRNFYAVMGLSDAAPADATASVGAPAAGRQASREARMKDRFAKLDADGDGQVSSDEFRAAAPGPRQGVADAGAVFDRIDDDGNGGIGDDEFRGGHERRGRPGPGGKKRGGKHGEPGMGRPPFPPPGMPPASGDLPPAPLASGDVLPPPASGDAPVEAPLG